MYIVVSNNGPWDYDMAGAIGVIESKDDLKDFVESKTDNSNKTLVRKLYNRENDINNLIEDNEMNFLADGKPVQAIEIQEPDCFSTIYVALEMSA